MKPLVLMQPWLSHLLQLTPMLTPKINHLLEASVVAVVDDGQVEEVPLTYE